MNTTNSTNPTLDGIWFKPFQVRPALVVTPSATGVTNAIPATIKVVEVGAVANDVNDWITLPTLADVPNGHEITILCNAGGNFELRTPASSNEEINSEDCDGTKEYLCTDTQIVKVVKINNTIGWMAHGYTAIGAVAVAVVPD
jgi:hypothetical protein